MKNFRQEGNVLDWTNGTAGAVKAGDVITFASVGCGIAAVDIAIGATGAVALTGVFRLTAASATTFAQGAPVSWDGTKVVAVGTGTPMGMAFVGKVSGVTYVDVKLCLFGPGL